MHWVSITSPAFELQYAADAGSARSPASEEIVTIAPRASIRCGSAARQTRNGAVRFVPITRFQRSIVCSATIAPAPAPALTTSASSRPNRSTHASTAS